MERYQNIPLTTNFFNRLGVNYTSESSPSLVNKTTYADFGTGQVLANFTPNFDFGPYVSQLESYPELIYTMNLQDPIDPDLYSPIGDFLKKFGLEDIAFELAQFFSGSLLNFATASVISDVGLVELGAAGGTPALRVLGNDGNHGIYDKILQDLGSSVLLNSTVIAAQRSEDQSRLIVQGPKGNKLIIAKQLLITIPPTYDQLKPIGLDSKETPLIQQFFGRGLYPGIVKISGLPSGVQYVNAGVDTTYNIPVSPAVNGLNPTTVEGLYSFWISSDGVLSYDDAQSKALASIKSFVASIPNITPSEPELVTFSSHTPWLVKMGADSIKNGTWKDIYGLQGYRGTWYAGSQFLPSSVQLWNYTETLIPSIMAKL